MIILQVTAYFSDASSIATVLACILSLICTVVTVIMYQQNRKATETTAYLTMKNDLEKDVFVHVSAHCRTNSLDIDASNSIENPGYIITDGRMQVNQVIFVRDVLGNIEDLALLHENKILSFNFIDSGYGYSILEIGNNMIVRGAIATLRNTGSVYNGFNNLYCKIYGILPYTEKPRYRPNILDP